MAVYNTNTIAYDNGEGLAETALITLKNGTIVDSDNRFPVQIGENYELQVAKGNISGTVGLYKFGVNPDVNGTEEDIWSVGGTLIYMMLVILLYI